MISELSTKESQDIEMGGSNNQQPIKSCGRRCFCWFWSDWTQVVGRLGLGGGLVAGCVGVAIKNPYVMAGGVAGVVFGYLFPDLRLSCLRESIDLNRGVINYGKTNEKLEIEVESLQKQIKKLEEISLNFEKDLKQASLEVEELKNNLKETTSKLETEKQLNTMKQLYEEFKKKTSSFAENLVQFNKNNNVFENQVRNVSKSVLNIEKKERGISEEIIELDSGNELFSEENKKLQEMMKELEQAATVLQKGFIEIQENLNEFKLQNENLSQIYKNFESGTNKFEIITNKLSQTINEFNQSDSSSEN